MHTHPGRRKSQLNHSSLTKQSQATPKVLPSSPCANEKTAIPFHGFPLFSAHAGQSAATPTSSLHTSFLCQLHHPRHPYPSNLPTFHSCNHCLRASPILPCYRYHASGQNNNQNLKNFHSTKLSPHIPHQNHNKQKNIIPFPPPPPIYIRNR